MMPPPRRARRTTYSLPAGGALLILTGCTVGIDDRPVPPALIPAAMSEASSPGTYGAPAENYPSFSGRQAATSAASETPGTFPSAAGGGMVWRTGAQPMGGSEPPPAAEAASSAELVPEAEPEQTSAEAGDGAEAPQAAASRTGDFRVSPIVGADAASGLSLLRALQAQAEVRGVGLDGGSGSMVLKTYLSSYPDAGETVLTYVFDVYAADATRLTRIDGQERVPAPGSWESAPPELVRSVAKTAMRRLEAWQAGAET
jgi:hypothetical protein